MTTQRQYPFFGFAPGFYLGPCTDCKEKFLGDKRSRRCEPCAELREAAELSAAASSPMQDPTADLIAKLRKIEDNPGDFPAEAISSIVMRAADLLEIQQNQGSTRT